MRSIAFHITDRCQLDCQHCLRDPAQRPKDLPLALIVGVLEQARATYAAEHVALTGGEPTLHPEFDAILDAVCARGFTWNMVTNGRTFPALAAGFDAHPARRSALTFATFSLDGADAATHDGVRGEGSFREVMLAVTTAAARGIPFFLANVVTSRNVAQIETFGLLASQLGAAGVTFSMLQPTGTHHDRALRLPFREVVAARDRVARLADTLKLRVVTPEGWPVPEPFHVCEAFASEVLHVTVDGRLNLCCQHSGLPRDPAAPSGEPDEVADLGETSLLEAHGRLLGVIHRTQRARLAALAAPGDRWDASACNWCLKHFGKPHWADEAPAGPPAERARWVGAWGEPKGQAPRRRLPVV